MGATMGFDAVFGKQWMVEILCISFVSALLTEALSWLFIYRKAWYITLVENLEREQKKLDRWKDDDSGGAKAGRSDKTKKIKTKEDRVKEMHKQLQAMKMMSSVVMGLGMVTVFSVLSNMYDAKVVAKLPFIPFGFITSLSHRNIPGDDLSDASYIFLYAISSMAIKANLQKALGFTPPSPPMGQNPFFEMPQIDEDQRWK